MEWEVRELVAEETHALRRAVSADGRTDLPSTRHELDASPGAWHLGAVDATGRVVATSSFYTVPCPLRPEARPAVQLQFMAVEPMVQRKGVASAVLAEAIRRLKATDAIPSCGRTLAILCCPSTNDSATIQGSGSTPPETGRPHNIIGLDLNSPASVHKQDIGWLSMIYSSNRWDTTPR
jgi:GNAT superfamily N-acetyltransferase